MLNSLRTATDAARRAFLPVDRAVRHRLGRPERRRGPDPYDQETEWCRLRDAYCAAVLAEDAAYRWEYWETHR